MAIDPDLLDRSDAEGARTLSLALLADATDEAARTGDAADVEALHDFRVAVRRLRSTLRAWRPALEGSLRKKDLRWLRAVAQATGDARDGEVLLAWVKEAREELGPLHRPAADWIESRLEHRRRHLDRAVAAAASEFLDRAPRLARRLASASGTSGRVHLGVAIAERIRAQADAVEAALVRASTPPDAERAHRARIEGKRLRYLLEPLRGLPGVDAAGAVSALKRMQDVLGDLNDARVAGSALAAMGVEAAAERVRSGAGEGPGLRPGLLALERAAHRRAAAKLAEVERRWFADRGGAALAPAREVARAVEAFRHPATPVDEPRPASRRFLLAGLPPEAAGPGGATVETGWLPGEPATEAFGAVRDEGGERFHRTVWPHRRGPAAPARPPRTEEVTREVFEAYWPLTEGRRIRRRSRSLPGGWRVDEYLDRSLVVAVCEEAIAEVPAWLEPWLVREVTDERAYRDEALSRRHPRPAEPAPGGPVSAG